MSVYMQWMSTISWTIALAFLYIWLFAILLFLFRPFQLMGVKGKLFQVGFLLYCLDALYCVTVDALGIFQFKVPGLLGWFPPYVSYLSYLILSFVSYLSH